MVEPGRLGRPAHYTYASFGCWEGSDPGDPSIDGGMCTTANIFVPWLVPERERQVGHADSAGNLWSGTLDWYDAPEPVTCTDCALLNAGAESGAQYRTLAGGSFEGNSDEMNSFSATPNFPDGNGLDYYGVRCVRLPVKRLHGAKTSPPVSAGFGAGGAGFAAG